MFKLNTLLLAASLGVGAAVGAHANVLDLKAGLWQTTAHVQMSMPSAMSMQSADLSKLSPAQRAQIQQMMAQMPGTSRPPIVTKSCVTDKQLADARNFAPANRPDCTQTILKSTPSEIDAQVVCTGKDSANMTGSFKSSSPEAFSGVLQGTVSEEGHTIPISNTMEGKWLGSDCGDVKPIDVAEKPTLPNVKPANPANPN